MDKFYFNIEYVVTMYGNTGSETKNTSTVGHCMAGKLCLIVQSFGWHFKPRSMLITHAFNLVHCG